MTSSSKASSNPGPAGYFATTHWSVVLHAGRETARGEEALARLCQIYWYPLYAYVRRQGHGPHDAEDLTQGFFASLLERKSLAGVQPEKGKFRSFLLAAMNHFLANEWDRVKAQKRGGGVHPLSLDATDAETRYRLEPADPVSADRIFDRRWAITLLDRVLEQLRGEYIKEDKADMFEKLKFALTGERSKIRYSELADKLGMSEGAVKVAVHRLRQRYREILRREIAQTVSSPEEIEDEIRHLFSVVAG
ncbi:MAG TPA: ECF-type sigma factor [Candidatus Dormibacteraeota bacterium]|nr:ECF-type sigma factor [Candidatus Dormibacteraeota bacterium]